MKLRLNITVKLIGYLLVVSILPLMVFAFSSYDLVRQTLIDLSSEYSVQLIGNQRDYLQQQMEEVENLASRIAGIEEISMVAAKTDAEPDASYSSYDGLSTQAQIRQSLNAYSNLKGIVSIDYFTAKGHRFYVGDTLNVPPVKDEVRLRIYNAAIALPDSFQWLGIGDNLNTASSAHKVLTALKIIRHYSKEKKASEPVGMLLINYSADYLGAHFRQVELGRESYVMVTDQKGRLAYAPERAQVGNTIPLELMVLAKAGSGHASLHLDGREVLVSFSCVSKASWCVFGVIPQATLLAPMSRITQTAALLILLCFVVIGAASRIFRRNVVAPIKSISDGFYQIQQHKLDVMHPLPLPASQDEIGELVAWFNAFLETLRLRDRYEKEIRDSQLKFANIFQFSPLPLGLVRVDNGEFIDVNDFWLTQFSYARDEVVGRTSFDLNLWVDVKDREKMMQQIAETGSVQRLEVMFRAKGGDQLTCLLSGKPIEFQGDRLFIFSPVDVTRQREVEQQIREVNLQLESRVLSRTEKLEQANNELEQAMDSLNRTKDELVRSEKMAALGSLVAGVAHELNTPIGNSVTVASTLQDETDAMRQLLRGDRIRRSTIEEYFDIVAKGTSLLMRNLVIARELIISFKQVAVDQASDQRRRFKLKETLEGVLVTLVPMYKKTEYQMHCDFQDDVAMDSYPGPLGQILTNFVTNSLAHAFDGRASGNMTLRTRQLDADHVEIAFSDDGVGIPEEYRARVFDPFFTTKLGQGGSGLGLNIVYNIVTGVLGGTIRLESQVGKGTTFIIELPLTIPDLEETVS